MEFAYCNALLLKREREGETARINAECRECGVNDFLLSLVIGLMAGSSLPELPAPSMLHWLWVADLLLVIGCWLVLRQGQIRTVARGLLVVAAFASGLLWALQYGIALREHRLPEVWANQDFEVEGVVIHLPEQTGRGERFDLKVTRILDATVKGYNENTLQKLRLNSFDPASSAGAAEGFRFLPAQRWRLWVRLKPPRGMVNPDIFDYEGWLLQQGYSAVGYVRNAADNHQLPENLREFPALAIAVQFDRWGWASLQWIKAQIPDTDRRALFAAIALGYQDEFTRHHWDLLRNTGTIHLVVVSGLNIVLAASTGFFLFGLIGRLLVFPLQWLPAAVWSAVGAFITAVAYAGMTGFSLPTQRSLVMVLCGLGTLLFRKRLSVSTGYLCALALVMLLDPLAATTASFWLSFGAVAILLYCFASRVEVSQQQRGWRLLLTRRFYLRCLATQCAVSLGLFPLIAVWMGYFPLITPLANLFAVPFATFVLMPMTILSGISSALSPWLGKMMLSLCGQGLDLFWWYLEQMQGLNVNWYLAMGQVPAAVVLLWSMSGVCVWLAPRGIFRHEWQRFLSGICLLLPLLLPWRDAIPPAEFRLTVVDVGQGLGMMIETAQAVTVYDVGDHYSEKFDMGRDVMAPLLRRRGYDHVDTLVISHADSDHAGGLKGLLGELQTRRLLSGNAAIIQQRLASDETHRLMTVPVESCVRGQSWRQDQVSFEMLGPLPAQPASRRNNYSCVLRISNAHFSVLLTGDIEQDEEALLLDQPGKLKSAVLVVPHHGSRSSSSPDFLSAIRPSWAIVSVGYHSQYGHPHTEIIERYSQLQIPLLRTDLSGAISIDSQTGQQTPARARESATGYWHRW
jgi:competence protein ComEC